MLDTYYDNNRLIRERRIFKGQHMFIKGVVEHLRKIYDLLGEEECRKEDKFLSDLLNNDPEQFDAYCADMGIETEQADEDDPMFYWEA